MQIAPFELERWQSVWENRVELNISESGVEPLTVRDLLDDPAADGDACSAYASAIRRRTAPKNCAGELPRFMPGARAENAILTAGCAEANFLVSWLLLEPGDEVVFMLPNYVQIQGLAESFRRDGQATLAARETCAGRRISTNCRA